MMAVTHAVSGIGAYALIAANSPLPLSVVAISGAFLGSLAPDLDDPKSWIGRRVPGISHSLNMGLGHRGILHTPFAGGALSAGMLASLVFIGGDFVWGFFLGFITHLLGDANTNSGVQLLWPFKKKKYRVPWAFATGGIVEHLLLLGLGWYLLFGTPGQWMLKEFLTGFRL